MACSTSILKKHSRPTQKTHNITLFSRSLLRVMPGSVLVRQPSSRMKIIKDGAEREDDVAGKDRRDDGPSRRPRMLPNAASEIRAVLKTRSDRNRFHDPKAPVRLFCDGLNEPLARVHDDVRRYLAGRCQARTGRVPRCGTRADVPVPDRFCETVLGFLK